MRRWNTILALSALAGCGGVTGEVGGRPVHGRTAIFDVERVDVPLLGSYDVIALALTDVPDACETYQRMNDAAELPCDESCAAVNTIAAEIGFDEHWLALVYATTEAGELPGTYGWTDASVPGDREFAGQLQWWDLRLAEDVAVCTARCENGYDIVTSDVFDAQSGSLTVEDYEPEVALRGDLDVGFGGEDVVSGPVNATSCPSLANF